MLVTASIAGALTPITTAASAATPAGLGLYIGGGNTSGFNAFAQWLGARPGYAVDFLSDQSWGTIDNPSWVASRWAGTGARLVLAVPMLPGSGASLGQEAAGSYNGYFRTLAQRLVAAGEPGAVIRLGWEFNGSWFPWSIKAGNGAQYAQAWREVVSTMRSVSGQQFAFDWCLNDGSSYVNGAALNAESAYPGDAFVNYIGMDVYDQSWVSNPSNEANRWNGYVNEAYGMAWQRRFAAAHGKPVSFPEWGLDSGGSGYGGGDSPPFIRDMYNWFKSSNLGYQSYFDFTAPDGDHALAHYPQAASVYRQLFSSSLASAAHATRASVRSRARRHPRRRPQKSHVRRAARKVHARRPALRVSARRGRRGTTLLTLTWSHVAGAVNVFANGHPVARNRRAHSLVLRSRKARRALSLSVCAAGTRRCSNVARVLLRLI